LALVKRHGWNATSFQVLQPAFRYWFDAEHDACVAYVETRGAWVAAGAPIVEPARLDAVVERFVVAARERGKRACFFAVESGLAWLDTLDSLFVGEQPVWDPRAWEECLRARRSLREQLRRAKAKGVRVRAVPSDEIADPLSPIRNAVEELVDAWLRTRPMAPMGFLVGVEPFAHADERRYFVAEKDGRVLGVLIAVPVYARNGWFFENLLRAPEAPNGTAELLVDLGMRAAAEEGSPYVTLGLAPLAGDVSPPLLSARAVGAMFYNFQGVREFKAKLGPTSWDPIYIVYPRGGSGTMALVDALEAFARGSFTRFGLETLLRGPAVVVRALAVLLLPWTVMLALADTQTWFPAPWVKLTWIGFDLVIALGMLSLARRWRPGLAAAITAAIAADAIATTAQVLAFNAARIHGLAGGIVLAVACLGPAFAAIVMKSAMGHRALRQR
jgi:phosphatidylglycerol lysyltransferase